MTILLVMSRVFAHSIKQTYYAILYVAENSVTAAVSLYRYHIP
jgi:hypothetical protein